MTRVGLLLVSLLTTACVVTSTPRSPDTVRQRAAYDLRCDQSAISVQNVGGNAYAARGCGAEQVYVCDYYGQTCVRDAAQQQPPAADPLPPPPAPTSVPASETGPAPQ